MPPRTSPTLKTVCPHPSPRTDLILTVSPTTGYINETKRLYGVLEIRLKDRDWLAGPGRGRYTIADINVLGWVRIHTYAGIESVDEWPNLKVRCAFARFCECVLMVLVFVEVARGCEGEAWRPEWSRCAVEDNILM